MLTKTDDWKVEERAEASSDEPIIFSPACWRCYDGHHLEVGYMTDIDGRLRSVTVDCSLLLLLLAAAADGTRSCDPGLRHALRAIEDNGEEEDGSD